jgi:hypothetical protein
MNGERPRALVALARGSAAGALATVAMSAAMLGFQHLGRLGHRQPPRLITERLLSLAGVRWKTPRPARRAAATALHFGFGAACGSLFELARATFAGRVSAPHPRVRLLAGLGFGTVIWASSYAGWVPAMGAMRMPSADRPYRPTSLVIAHLIYGASLALAVGRLDRRGDQSQPTTPSSTES